MKTKHQIFFKNAQEMDAIESNTVDLVITSPPYPMIELWDGLFISMNEGIDQALKDGNSKAAFNLMHQNLQRVWREIARVLKIGGTACINIGDATRKIKEQFQLFPNHSKVISFFQKNGFISLPSILWRKPTNSPTKFLGSGMLPPNAYVTLEHEYILIFRKGNKTRTIPPKSKSRYQSAYFWEERNRWFSDIWEDIRGISQDIHRDLQTNNLRDRTAAFPLALPYRLINMFSIQNDVILDPFWGTGTTTIAAMASGRNSIGYEINVDFKHIFDKEIQKVKEITRDINETRIKKHNTFIKRYKHKKNKEPKYLATNYNLPVITKQEKNILLHSIKKIEKIENGYYVYHMPFSYLG
ncbi:MAG: site-specific DNA-methyltransferase [Candidatus Heimdallarchaeota archaeon]|nr:site-specific DNA-methyltransferase [Candidatus Heimdallarchaeota archaeon]